MKVIKLIFFTLFMSAASSIFLQAMEKEQVISPLEDIKKSVETFDFQSFLPVWESNANELTDSQLEDLLTFILNLAENLNAQWLQHTYIDRNLLSSLKDIPTLAEKQAIQNKMTGIAAMAGVIKGQWEKKNPEKNIFLVIGAKNYITGLSDWNWYLHLQTTAKSIIEEIESVNQQRSRTLFADQDIFKVLINIVYYSCMLPNTQKNKLVKEYFSSEKFLIETLADTKYLLLIGYAAPLIKENKGGYGYTNIIDLALINGGDIKFVKDLFGTIGAKNLVDDIYNAVNNLCVDKNGKRRVALDLLIITRVESSEDRTSDITDLIKLIYEKTDVEFLKESSEIKEYVRVLDWLKNKKKEFESKTDKDLNSTKKKIGDLIKLLTDLNNKNKKFPAPKVETEVEKKQRIAREKREKKKEEEAKKLMMKDSSKLSSATETQQVGLVLSTESSPDTFNADLLNAIKNNDDKRVKELLNGKTITDDAQAKEYLLAAIANGIRLNEDLLEKARKLRELRASNKSDTKVEQLLSEALKQGDEDSAKSVIILRTLSDAIRDFSKDFRNTNH